MRCKAEFAVLILLMLPISAGAVDPFDLSPPHNIGVSTTADASGGRAGNLSFSATSPSDWIFFGGAGRKRNETDGESADTRNWRVGFSTDQLATFFFEAMLDEDSHPGLFKDTGGELRLGFQPAGEWLGSWTFGVNAGARRFVFSLDPQLAPGKADLNLPSRSIGLSVSWFPSRNWDFILEGKRYFYPDEVRDFNDEVAPYFVPNDTLDYAFGLPDTATRIAAGWSAPWFRRHRPRLSLALSSSRKVVDGSVSGSFEIGLGLRLTRSFHLDLAVGSQRSISGNTGASVGFSSLGFTYSWK